MWNDTCRMLPTFYLDATGGRGGIEEELRRNWGRCCWRGFHHGVPSSSPAVGAATTGNISLSLSLPAAAAIILASTTSFNSDSIPLRQFRLEFRLRVDFHRLTSSAYSLGCESAD